MTPPPSICLMQLLRKRATDIKRHSVPGGGGGGTGHGEGQDAGHWLNIQDRDDSDLSSVPHTSASPTGTTVAEHPTVPITLSLLGSVWGNRSSCPISEQVDGSSCLTGRAKGRQGAGWGNGPGAGGCYAQCWRCCQTHRQHSNRQERRGHRGWGPSGTKRPSQGHTAAELVGEPRRPRASSTHPRTANGAIFSS